MNGNSRLIEEFQRLIWECENHLRHYEANPKLRVVEKSPGEPEVDVTERENERDRQLIAECQRLIDRLKSA